MSGNKKFDVKHKCVAVHKTVHIEIKLGLSSSSSLLYSFQDKDEF
jgi:hypothetical protein